MPDDLGLRAVKKRETRRLLGEAAWELFAARGFDNVTVAEIARAAMVSEKTVFNYFPTKEDLFFTRLEEFAERLVEAVRDREPAAVAAEVKTLGRRAFVLLADGLGDFAIAGRRRRRSSSTPPSDRPA